MRFDIKVPYFRKEAWYTCGRTHVLAFTGIIKTEDERTEVCVMAEKFNLDK